MKIAVVGNAHLSENQRAHARLLIHMIVLWYEPLLTGDLANGRLGDPVTLISGGAKGVDSLAEEEWTNKGWPKEIFYPKSARWEPEGYKERNLKIAEACDILYCIRAKDSKTYGSGWTADRAEEMGKQTWRYWV